MDPLLRVVIIWIIGFGTISILIKERVSKKLIELGIPLPAGYYLLVTPIILMEEALTIEGPYFWGILPMILAFYSLFLILFIIQRVGRIDNWIMVVISGTLGWINEFLIVGRINQMDGPVLIIMSLLCWLIYAVMEILPSTYIQRKLSQGNNEQPRGKPRGIQDRNI